MEQTQKSWVGKVRTLPRKVLTGVAAQVQKGYGQLKSRYGPRYTKAMIGTAFVALFSPIPGSVPVAVALIMVIAEAHRAISKRGGFPKASAKELVMSIKCDVILRWSATPAELTDLGAALWRWCNHAAGDTGIYQYFDNQALADLIAGRLPASGQMPWQAERRGVLLDFEMRRPMTARPPSTACGGRYRPRGSRISWSRVKAGP